MLLAAAMLAVVAAPSALGSRQVVGGEPADVRAAPWSVVVVHGTPSNATLCTGAIIDSSHVLTAAHCVFDAGGTVASPSSFMVLAGVSDAVTPSATDRPQEGAVAAVRVHPEYQYDSRPGPDDVAVLTLAAPLDLSGPTAQAIALPSPGLRFDQGQAVSLAGYGVTTPVNGGNDASLHRMTSTVVDDTSCVGPMEASAGAVLLCAFSGTNSPCFGDSGSALVLPGPPPVAIGVAGSATCSRNTAATFADLTAPEILDFVEGNDDPPLAPRNATAPVISSPTSPPQVGETMRCEAGTWSETPSLAYLFFESASGTEVAAGPSHRLGIGDANARIACRVTATSAGGRAVADSGVTGQVAPPPDVVAAPASARPGTTAVLRVRLFSWIRPVAGLTVCATPPLSVGARTCRTVAPAGSSVSIRLAVKRTASAGTVRVAVSARATDGRSAAEPATLVVG
jgi:hypothetical protein